MNRFMQEQWPMFDGTHKMSLNFLDTLSDADLAFNPGGQNITLGALCRQMGEVEYSYIQSLKNFKQDWAYHNTEPGLDSSVSKLKEWYQALNAEMESVLTDLTDEDFKKTVDRDGYAMPLEFQLQAYLQALLIFFGKATIYLKAMNKPLTEQFQTWIW